ncbi:MAG: phenylalanine--tRNA ligase subunit beta [Candidatus ainarchaeum sp.]|nr:phenylalanine--tRNA ligase subunit beta [Candidatus ainarchaeum sp.]
MPKIDVSRSDLESLLHYKIKDSELEKFFLCTKCEVDGVDGDTIKLDIKDSNRPDLWSIEGVAREIKKDNGEIKGLKEYSFEKSDYIVDVGDMKNIAKYVAAAVVKNVDISDDFLISLVNMQEKIAGSYGKKRSELSMGMYDLNKISGKKLKYFLGDKKTVKFAPLGFEKEMTLEEVLKNHKKGQEYGHLLAGFDKYPVWQDEKGKIMSMPPIVNSNDSGKVEVGKNDLFIEVTGITQEKVNVALLIVCMAFADRGAKVEAITVDYGKEKVVTPYFAKEKMEISKQKIFDYIGMEISEKDLIGLLERKGYDVKIVKDKVVVEYPNYRVDIMHPVDVIEDILISIGYNTIKLEKVDVRSTGGLLDKTVWADSLRLLGVGAGLQEIMTFTLTSKEKQFGKMKIKNKAVTIANPMSESIEIFRTSIVPEHLEFLVKNQHISYPQNVFEVGKILEENDKGILEKIFFTATLCYEGVDYTYAKRLAEFVLNNLEVTDKKYTEFKHNSFIEGRVAKIEYKLNGKKKEGIIGEINPEVLKNFNLETPVAVFELDLTPD